MSDYPNDKKPIKLEYTFEDNSKIFIEGEQLEFFIINLKASGSFCSMHGFKFLPIDWSEGK
jgi:hypothetical protein